jgi:hypothetical protein
LDVALSTSLDRGHGCAPGWVEDLFGCLGSALLPLDNGFVFGGSGWAADSFGCLGDTLLDVGFVSGGSDSSGVRESTSRRGFDRVLGRERRQL